MTAVCNVTTCRRPARAKGLCERHYKRLQRHGDAEAGPARTTRGIDALLTMTGLTYRQLDWWTTQGYLQPSTPAGVGSGNARDWPDDELRIAALMGRLTKAGVTACVAARLARELTHHGRADLGDGLQLTTTRQLDATVTPSSPQPGHTSENRSTTA